MFPIAAVAAWWLRACDQQLECSGGHAAHLMVSHQTHERDHAARVVVLQQLGYVPVAGVV